MTHSGPDNLPREAGEPTPGADRERSSDPPLGEVQAVGHVKAVGQVQTTLATLRETLVSSGLTDSADGASAITAQAAALEDAIRQLEQLRDRVASGEIDAADDRDQLAGQLTALHQEILRNQHLLHQANEFWLGWAGLLGLDTGYTAAGMVAPLTGTHEIASSVKISVEG